MEGYQHSSSPPPSTARELSLSIDVMIKYHILNEYHIIVERVRGKTSVEDLVGASRRIWEDNDYDKKYDAIVDVREADMNMSHGDISAFADLILASGDASEGKVALISSKPMETALGYLFSKRVREQSSAEVFSTWEGVGTFLGLSPSLMDTLTDDRAYDALFE